MNVWIRKLRKRATCTYDGCPIPQHEIKNGEYAVVCQWVMKTKGGKNWRKARLFHPQCWIDQAVAELERRPVVETRGYAKRMAITDADRERRVKILRKRASLVQRIKLACLERKYALVEKLTEQLELCKEEIRPYGGVPAKW